LPHTTLESKSGLTVGFREPLGADGKRGR
jgi:hypothetical protein